MTADAAAAEPVTSNDTTSNDLAGEHVTGDETPRLSPYRQVRRVSSYIRSQRSTQQVQQPRLRAVTPEPGYPDSAAPEWAGVSNPFTDLTQCVPPRANGIQPAPHVLLETQRAR